jgi:hypothetical protein
LVLGQDQGFSEDPTNVAEELTEAPTQSSEASDTPATNPTQKGKPRCIPQYFNLLQSHYYITYLALHLAVEMKTLVALNLRNPMYCTRVLIA